jgi:cell pole-organizing protein PopZ
MGNFNNNVNNMRDMFQADEMHFGGAISSTDELKRQVADLQTLLARLSGVPEEKKAPVAKALQEAAQTPPGAPDAKSRIVAKLEEARGFLKAATGVAAQAAPLITAITAVVGAAGGLIG